MTHQPHSNTETPSGLPRNSLSETPIVLPKSSTTPTVIPMTIGCIPLQTEHPNSTPIASPTTGKPPSSSHLASPLQRKHPTQRRKKNLKREERRSKRERKCVLGSVAITACCCPSSPSPTCPRCPSPKNSAPSLSFVCCNERTERRGFQTLFSFHRYEVQEVATHTTVTRGVVIVASWARNYRI
eukprot:TRINITY_DN9078_c2_g3_i2.p1 TRINITY_DN9078_c2_g3~~TRINITY_DN9078_c2_g3_i2.p1  ORF type:complete len:184 (+),score=13.60 TRINITY_DN9078_c2_g3_i2:79-630(+)